MAGEINLCWEAFWTVWRSFNEQGGKKVSGKAWSSNPNWVDRQRRCPVANRKYYAL